MKALVTGSTGFVGSHIARALVESGHDVRALHRTTSRLDVLAGLKYESAIGDVTDSDSLRTACAGIDWVFHVAAVADYWRADKTRLFHVNVEGTRKVLEAAREANVKRVIFTSSVAAIGWRSDGLPSDESLPFNLPPERFPYGYSKVLAEEVVAEAVAAGQDVVILNPVVIMGPGDLNMISGSFITQVKRLQWAVPIASGGVSVIDVRDVARGHLAAAEKGRTGERYILSTANYSHRELLTMIAEIVGAIPPFIRVPDFVLPPVAALIDLLRKVGISMPVDANQTRLGARKAYFDAGKAHTELGVPLIDMRQSLRDTYVWYMENGYIKEDIVAKFTAFVGRLFRREKHTISTG